MDNNLKIIKEEFHNYKGQFVITESWKVERFIAIADDNMDYYYVTYDGRKLTFNTCVGRIIPLKGKIDDKYYNEFIRLAKINHNDQVSLWMNKDHEARKPEIEKHKSELTTLQGNDKFITEICWDIN